MTPTITVDDKQVMVRFGTSGIPETVRTRLRTLIPGIAKQFGREIDNQLATGLKSRRSLKTNFFMSDQGTRIGARVSVTYQGGDEKKKNLPLWLDSGTKEHPIVATGLKGKGGPMNLFFYWEKIGANFIGPRVMHPVYPGIHYMEKATEAMRSTIIDQIVEAAVLGMKP